HDHEGDKHDDHGHDHEGDKHDDHDDHDHHHHSGRDPHIWMSPRRVAVMVDSIAEALAKLDAENADYYLSNAKAYREKLDQLTSDLHKLLHDSKDKSFIIMHPSMGYFAEDFDLEQISIEKEGKQATADHMKSVIDYARENNIKVIFYQKEFDNNQAKTIASEIGGEVMELEPLAENYLQNLEKIGQAFAKVLGK
ncbi:MAG: zinc ABC transporter substrate-binding protein, partial [Eubacteriales bacterium]|nr:zinc ABC transporter substrate-binding protein [Eubacteriales bacterium]